MKKKIVSLLVIPLVFTALVNIFVFNFDAVLSLNNKPVEYQNFDAVEKGTGGVYNDSTYVAFRDNSYLKEQYLKKFPSYEIKNIDKVVTTLSVQSKSGEPIKYVACWEDQKSRLNAAVGTGLLDRVETYKSGQVRNFNSTGKTKKLYIYVVDKQAVKSVAINVKKSFNFTLPGIIITFSASLLFMFITTRKVLIEEADEELMSAFSFRNKTKDIRKTAWLLIATLLVLVGIVVAQGVNQVELRAQDKDQYNYFTPRALLDGQLNLEAEMPDAYYHVDDIYDMYQMQEVKISQKVATYPWDFAFYKGKFYQYFGIAPTLLIFTPYYYLRGEPLPSAIFVLIATVIALIFLFKIYDRLTKKFTPNAPWFAYILGFPLVFALSYITALTSRSQIYEVAVSSAVMLDMLGIFALIKYTENKSKKSLFWASIALALAVACRPVSLLYSFAYLFILIPEFRNKTLNIKKIITIFSPYAVVAGGLMWFNAVRFGSPLEFGVKYNLTVINVVANKFQSFKQKGLDYYYIADKWMLNAPVDEKGNPFRIVGSIGLLLLPVFYINIFAGFVVKNLMPLKAKIIYFLGLIAIPLLSVVTLDMLGNNQRYLPEFYIPLALGTALVMNYTAIALNKKNKLLFGLYLAGCLIAIIVTIVMILLSYHFNRVV
ncbi:MAG: hypothetical protein LBN08_02990 [Lactobacillales bacterium]|jgi:hypothetical protein|nr:hypothetical protein [Lactobacillales bacterium]